MYFSKGHLGFSKLSRILGISLLALAISLTFISGFTSEVEASQEENKEDYKRLEINSHERDLLAHAVYSEARGEPYKGQVAVAAVIINRVEDSRWPDNVEGVIFEPWAFTAVHDGQFWLQPNETAYDAVSDALKGWDPSEGATFYYNPVTATSEWIFTRTPITTIGKHVFAY
ncbi:cell wall hydrolase [Natranaerobius thermophilus]|uniref:cell wall hydrolase n=1 Tax=Natranaerobius thermophilus TaxID=375929 RepID=UPI00016649DB